MKIHQSIPIFGCDKGTEKLIGAALENQGSFMFFTCMVRVMCVKPAYHLSRHHNCIELRYVLRRESHKACVIHFLSFSELLEVSADIVRDCFAKEKYARKTT